MQQINLKDKKIAIQIGAEATANIKAETSLNYNPSSTAIDIRINESSISISVDVNVDYNTISSLVELSVQQKRIQLKAPFFKLDVGIHKVNITAGEGGILKGEAYFSGTHSGKINFEGKPLLDSDKNELKIEEVKQEVKTGSILINIGKWLFQKKIESELQKLTTVNLNIIYKKAIIKLDKAINKALSPGISSLGNIQTVKATGLTILQNTIILRLLLVGAVQLILDAKAINFYSVEDENTNNL